MQSSGGSDGIKTRYGNRGKGREQASTTITPTTSDGTATDMYITVSETTGTTAGRTEVSEPRLIVASNVCENAEEAISTGTVIGRGSNRSRKSRSSRSTKARAELEARLKLQQAEAALARTQWELAKLSQDEDSDSSDGEEQQAQKQNYVQSWVRQSIASAPTRGEQQAEVSRDTHGSKPEESVSSLTQAIVDAIKLAGKTTSSHITCELPCFNGDPTEWIMFKRVFEDTCAQFSEVQNVARLRKALHGEARETVRALLFTMSEAKDVMCALERRYGRAESLILTEIEGVKRMTQLSENCSNIGMFANKVANTVASIRALGQPQYLHSPELVSRITEKLSTVVRLKWFEYKAENATEPELQRISSFLNKLSDQIGTSLSAERYKTHDVDKKRSSDLRTSKNRVHVAQEYSSDESSDEQRGPTARRKSNERKTLGRKSVRGRIMATSARGNNCVVCRGTHSVDRCDTFGKLSVRRRWHIAKRYRLCFLCLIGNHSRETCRRRKCGVAGCELLHHRLLHYDNRVQGPPETIAQREESSDARISTVNTVHATCKTYLKIVPVVLYGPKGKVSATALLDEGSTMTLIEESLALKIAHRGPREELHIEGVCGKKVNDNDSFKLELKIRGEHAGVLEGLRAQTIKGLNLAPQAVCRNIIKKCKHLSSIADGLVYDLSKPTILIGQDNWDLIVTRKLRSGKKNLPVASYTKLGWVLHGSCGAELNERVNTVCHVTEDRIECIVREHFSLESLGVAPRKPSNDPEQRALALLEKTTQRIPGDRFEVGLLWRTDDERMPANRSQALKRLENLEKKLEKSDVLKVEYTKQINNLIDKGYAEKILSNPTSERTWYLPHFAVMHPQKKKIRLVFDAAARTHGRCLNDALLTGPDLLQSLFGVLLRFREGSVAVMADIREMFLQVKIRPEDRDSLRFLWRNERGGNVEEYRMTSLIFGAASSPCTAIYVKNKNAREHADTYPEAAIATEKNFYMDDYLQAFEDKATAEKVILEVNELHKKASFELRGWTSNHPDVLRHLENKNKCESASLGDRDHAERTLGLVWYVNRDTLGFATNLRNTPTEAIDGTRPPTKRELTSAVMSVFDPLGLASPITALGRVLIQKTWRASIEWDESVPEGINVSWQEWLLHVKNLGKLSIPRPVLNAGDKGELHTFTDASEKAYAAAVYYVSIDGKGARRSTLVAAKARVTPLKPVSIPRLELQAALLGCRLAASVMGEMRNKINERIFWSDSRTVLAWIHSDPRTFKPFVAHRLAEIEELSKPSEWRWVPTNDNVADDATRDAPLNFTASHRWFVGPEFLRGKPEDWPVAKEKIKAECDSENKIQKVNVHRRVESPPIPSYRRFSSFTRYTRATARLLQAVDIFKLGKSSVMAMNSSEKELPRTKNFSHVSLNPRYLDAAEKLIVKIAQNDSFPEEINRLKKGENIMKSSSLNRVVVMLDNESFLRLDGRIPTSPSFTYEKSKPIILDGKHEVTRLMLEEYHRRFGHANHETVINEIRQKYYVIGLRNAVRKVVHGCQWCRVYRAKPQDVPQGNLPIERIRSYTPAFNNAAVDYFGPMTVTIGRRREKRWGVLFTCLSVRAVHLELAESLTPSSMIMAFRRFVARRGKPAVMLSDNGTNFKAADKELSLATLEINKEMADEAQKKYITWKYIPPGAPHMGGAWERLVRSVKTALAATLKERSPKSEVLHTLLLEAEHIVNSRPLIPANQGDDDESLTPNHFLLGRSSGDRPPGVFTDKDLIGKTSWRAVQVLADHFWSRWVREYLPTLLPRSNGGTGFVDPKEGDLVLIVDHTLPRNSWPRGKVHKALPGKDGRTRVVEVQTKNGILRRPASRIVILETAPSLE